MAIEGTLETFQLPEILQMISSQRKTGILTVQGEADIVAVSFKDGQVVAADALNQTVEEGLGQILASQGLVSPKDFASITAEHDGGGKRLLDLLLERGFVERGQLLEALRLQTYRLLLQLLRWDQGEFKFYSGEEVAFEEGFYAISVEELLIRSLSDLGEDGQVGGPPDLTVAYERVPGGPAIRYIGPDGATTDAPGVWVAGEDRPLVERLDGRTPVGKLADETGVGHYRALFTLYKLLRAGAVRAVGKPTKPSAPPAAQAAAAAPRPGAAPVAQRPPAPAAPRPASATPHRPVAVPAPGPSELGEELPEVGVATAPPAAVAPSRRPTMVRPTADRASGVTVWLPRLVALLSAVAVFAAPWLAPRLLPFPFPGEDATRAGLERNQRTAQYLQIDRAARTYFLLEGHYPDGLQELVGLDLLTREALSDAAGRRLAYSAEDVAYEIQPVVGGEPVAELGVHESISGDFLLDPDFLEVPDRSDRPPLVLLD
jgi:hypothetical protein